MKNDILYDGHRHDDALFCFILPGHSLTLTERRETKSLEIGIDVIYVLQEVGSEVIPHPRHMLYKDKASTQITS